MHIIPGKTKVKIELFKGIGLADFLIGLAFVCLTVLALTSPVEGKLYIAGALLFAGILLLVKIGDEPNYMFILSMLRHIAYRKSYSKETKGKGSINNISAFKDIKDGFIVYEDYFGAAIEIPPVEFRFLSKYRRQITVDDCLGNVLRGLNINYAANLVKIERKVPYDGYIENEKAKVDQLRHAFECALITEEEYQARCEVIFDRMHELENMNGKKRIVEPYYYLVFFDADRSQLTQQMDSAIATLQRGEMNPRRLNSKELAVFLKYTNEIDFDEKEADVLEETALASWAMPDRLEIKANSYVLDGMTAYTMAINNYPLRVGDAWIAGVMSIPATKVVVKLQPMDKGKTVRNIDRSLSELQAKYRQSGVESTLIELSDHIKSLSRLLSMLQSDNEVLLNTDVYVTCYDAVLTKKEGREKEIEGTSRRSMSNMRQMIRKHYREAELRLSALQFGQVEGYIGSQISGYDPMAKTLGRGIPGASAAAMYPWIYAHVQDPLGIKLGTEDGTPVFIDMFRRDSERVNSNIVIVGKSGSGKSYAAKSILVNLAADNSKIFVLDPENEYTELAENLHGKFINVGNAQQGRMNPFQIITSLEDDDAEGTGVTGSYASHMQFLEEFFRQILPDCDKDALEYLNSLAERTYMNRGITEETNLSLLRPEDYPVFDDLYDAILKEFQSTDSDYLRSMLRSLMNYVSKFSTGGRNANIWNGPSTVTTEENFTVFNFQSLLAGGNQTVTNAQMLLVMKYIDNEIIKNREYNNRYNTNRKIVVVIDEAHVFIDEKYPIALDFMFQLAKRIRKYNGMQIVITQNIKDFVGSEEISRKSSAIINACQYSFIFPLAPNDMTDLCKLYEKAGGINENEQDKIITAPRGNAFVILGPNSRSSFQVVVPKDVIRVFRDRNLKSRYFAGEKGRKAWEEYLGDSREKYLSNRKLPALPEASEENAKASRVSLVELSEEEYELTQQLEKESIRGKQESPEKRVTFSSDEPWEEPDYGDFISALQAEEEPLPVQTAAPQPRAVIQEAVSGSSAELIEVVSELRKTVESMGKLSHEALINEIMEKLGAAQAPVGYRTAPAPAAAEYEPAYEPESREEEESFYDEDDPLRLLDEMPDEDLEEGPGFDEDGDEDELTMQQLIDQLDMEQTLEFTDENDYGESSATDETDEYSFGQESPEDGEEDEDDFDILEFLDEVASEIDSVTALDEMLESGETIRIITLDELIKLNQSRKKQ